MTKIDEQQILDALKVVQDPDLHQDIVSLGFIKNLAIDGGKVSFTLELTTPACPMRHMLQEQSQKAVLSVPGVEEVNVTLGARVRGARTTADSSLLPGVKNIIPVASGKGGVGKSTVSVNLALALAESGAKVGIMDADVYGPSVPQLLGISVPEIEQEGQSIKPMEKYGLKIISMGFFLPQNQAVVWRGPMLHQMLTQFLSNVDWGELDYLVIDLPPGTGDAHLTICQTINITGAIVVSTPQDLALSVAQKAVFMFQKLDCRVLGVVKNMSHYICGHCGEREDIFGKGEVEDFCRSMGLPLLGEIPLAKEIRVFSDQGKPIMISAPDSPQSLVFRQATEKLAAEISKKGMQTD